MSEVPANMYLLLDLLSAFWLLTSSFCCIISINFQMQHAHTVADVLADVNAGETFLRCLEVLSKDFMEYPFPE